MNRLILRRITCLDSEARDLSTQGRHEKAISILEEVCRLVHEHLGEDHPWLISRLLDLAANCRKSGRIEKAESFYREVIERLSEHCADPLDLARGLNALGVLYCEMEDHEKAIKFLRRALTITRGSEIDELGLAVVLNNLAGAYHSLKQYQHAEGNYREALQIYRGHKSSTMLERAHCLCDLAELLTDRGERAEVKKDVGEAIGLYRVIYANDAPMLARALYRVAGLYRRLHLTSQAIDLLEEAAECLQRSGTDYVLELSHCLDHISDMRRC